MMALELTKGEHEIRFTYHNKAFTAGLLITVGCSGDAYDLSVAYHLGLIDDYELAEIYAMFNLYDRAVRQVNKEW